MGFVERAESFARFVTVLVAMGIILMPNLFYVADIVDWLALRIARNPDPVRMTNRTLLLCAVVWAAGTLVGTVWYHHGGYSVRSLWLLALLMPLAGAIILFVVMLPLDGLGFDGPGSFEVVTVFVLLTIHPLAAVLAPGVDSFLTNLVSP